MDARIVFRIFAGNKESLADAFSRQSVIYVDGGTQGWSWFAGSRPADHLVIREQCQSDAAGSSETQCVFRDEPQNGIDVVTDLADFAANRYHRRFHRERFVMIGDRDSTAGGSAPYGLG